MNQVIPIRKPGLPLKLAGGLPPARLAAAAGMPNQFSGWLTPQAAQRWISAGVSYYSPQQVEYVLRDAMAGDLVAQWEMFDLMEITWHRLQKNLAQLKDTVAGMHLQVMPWAAKDEDPPPEAETRARLVEEALWTMAPDVARDENDLEDTIKDLLDARGKGLSVLEVAWETRQGIDGLMVAPRATHWVHPKNYAFSKDDNALLFRPDPTRGNLIEFPEHRFLIGAAKAKTGPMPGSALLHVLGWWWCATNFSAEWFLNYAQIFGQPIRWATYDSNLSDPDKVILRAALENMGSNAWAAFPAGTQLELKEAARGSGDIPQMSLLQMADKICDLVILRQTLTSDVGEGGTGSRALGEVHERKEQGVEMACATWVCKTLRPLIRAICLFNFNDDTLCPWLKPVTDDEEDPKELAETLKTLNDAGLEPTDDALPDLSERLNVELRRKAATPAPMPGDGSAPPGKPKGADEEEEETEEELAMDLKSSNGQATTTITMHAKTSRATEKLIDNALEELTGVEARWLGGVKPFFRDLVLKAQSKDVSDAEFIAALESAARRMPELFDKLEPEAVEQALFEAMSAAAVNGAARGHLTRRVRA